MSVYFPGNKDHFLVHYRYFLCQQHHFQGNLYDFPGQHHSDLVRQHHFLVHHRYFLSRQHHFLGNLYDFLGQHRSDLVRKDHFLHPFSDVSLKVMNHWSLVANEGQSKLKSLNFPKKQYARRKNKSRCGSGYSGTV